MSVEEASFLAWVKHYRPDENTREQRRLVLPEGRARRARARPRAAARRPLARRPPPDALRAPRRGRPAGGRRRAGRGGAPRRRGGARRFFDRFVRGTEPLELDLELVGLRLRRRAARRRSTTRAAPPRRTATERPAPGWLGAELDAAAEARCAVACGRGAPPHRAGLYAEDEIVAEGGFRVDRAAPLGSALRGGARRDAAAHRLPPRRARRGRGAPRAAARGHRLARARRRRDAEQRAAFEAWSGTAGRGGAAAHVRGFATDLRPYQESGPTRSS